MNNKKKFIVIAVIIVILIVVIKINKGKNNVEESQVNENISTEFDEEFGKYEVYDSTTNELITSTQSEEGAELEKEFYAENPDYSAEPPESPNVE